MQRTIRDAMHRGVVTCAVGANAAEAAKTMLDNDVSALVVVDERLNACGVISKTDLIRFYGKELSSITAEDIMTSEIFTVSADTLVHEAVQLLTEQEIYGDLLLRKPGADELSSPRKEPDLPIIYSIEDLSYGRKQQLETAG